MADSVVVTLCWHGINPLVKVELQSAGSQLIGSLGLESWDEFICTERD